MSLKIKKTANTLALPSSLWGFYKNYAFKGFGFILILFCIVNLITFADGIFWPYAQQKFIHMFEESVPMGMSLIRYAFPTIAWIVGVYILLDLIQIFSNF